MRPHRSTTDVRGQAGFTLIELLVVIAILTVLGGVVVLSLGTLSEDAGISACTIEERTLRTAASAHVTGGGNPASVADLVAAGFLVDANTTGDWVIAGDSVTAGPAGCPDPTP